MSAAVAHISHVDFHHWNAPTRTSRRSIKCRNLWMSIQSTLVPLVTAELLQSNKWADCLTLEKPLAGGDLWCPVDVICHNFFIVYSRFFLIHDAAVILLYIYPVFAVNRPNRKITVHNRAIMQSRCRLGLKRAEQLTGRQQPEMNPGPWLCESNHGLLTGQNCLGPCLA